MGMPTSGDRAISSCGGAADAAHQWPPGRAMMSRSGKVKAVGAHRFVLSPVRGGDATAQRRSILNAEAPVALIGGGVILEHWRGKASKAGVLLCGPGRVRREGHRVRFGI
jgi:hypothetical protein